MTDSSNSTSAAQSSQSGRHLTYGDIVWEQFKKHRVSYWSLWGVVVLFIIAVFAPVMALNVPFFIAVPEGVGPEHLQGLSFPWVSALFNFNFFESGVDLFFNTLLFTLPLAALTFAILWRLKDFESAKHRRRFVERCVAAALVASVAIFLLVFFTEFRQPYVDYVSLAEMDRVSAFFPPMTYSYRDTNVMTTELDPSWTHWLGTDREGRDVFTRMLYGTRISLTVGVVAVVIYTAIGMFLGSVGGYFGGRVDMLVLRMIEVMLCFPAFFLILTLRGFIEQASIIHIMVIIGLTRWTGTARLVRGEFLRLKNQDFVQAAIALGLRKRRIIFRHLMPNALGPVLVSATFGVAGAILIEASLSFLGLGPTTAPSWGQILNSGRQTGQWALILAPGFAIFVTVSLLNLVGEGVRDAIDPKMRK